LARERIAALGCHPVRENPKAFIDRGGLSRLEAEAAEVAVRRVREAAYPLIFKLFGGEMPGAEERKVVLDRLGKDLARIERNLGYRSAPWKTTRASRQEGAYIQAENGSRRPSESKLEGSRASISTASIRLARTRGSHRPLPTLEEMAVERRLTGRFSQIGMLSQPRGFTSSYTRF